MFTNRFWRHGPQVELQTTRKHRHRYFLGIGGGKYELQILGRLFERFQHGIKSRVGQHMHLVNHEDFKATLDRFVNRLL